jgi:hypothetical protein
METEPGNCSKPDVRSFRALLFRFNVTASLRARARLEEVWLSAVARGLARRFGSDFWGKRLMVAI